MEASSETFIIEPPLVGSTPEIQIMPDDSAPNSEMPVEIHLPPEDSPQRAKSKLTEALSLLLAGAIVAKAVGGFNVLAEDDVAERLRRQREEQDQRKKDAEAARIARERQAAEAARRASEREEIERRKKAAYDKHNEDKAKKRRG